MNKVNPISEYLNYVEKTGSRRKLYELVAKEYNIISAIYPGSYIDIDPSLFIEKVIYIDNFKKTNKFFSNIEIIKEYIKNNKYYENEPYVEFMFEDYNKLKGIDRVDLIISQYAGFVGNATKQFLRTGGILLANDSHGDASLAYFDKDFKLVATIYNNQISTSNLDQYFILNKNKKVDISIIKEKMKGLNYKKKAENYIFIKIKKDL